ncbi:MAG: zinc ribbon domain-containing protein [Planctomycetes bacterium]|nr:zinc ribbon domain-containing protein [Planctomycetota bacterium]
MKIPCPHCGTPLRASGKFAGRRGLCPACEGSLVLPAVAPPPAPNAAPAPATAVTVDPGAPHGEASIVRRAVAYGKSATADDNRLYLKVAAEKGFLVGAMIEKAQRAHERLGLRAQAPAMGEFLVERGFLTADENRTVILLLNRARAQLAAAPAAAGSRPRTKGSTRECPNCFETINAESKSCRYCGIILTTPELTDHCPNCFGQQAPGGQFCLRCGANMETGLVGDQVRRRCPKCGILATGMETICVVCRTPFDRAEATVVAGQVARGAAQVLYDHRGFLVLGLLLLGCVWLYRNREVLFQGVSAQLHGASEAALRRRVDDFGQALRYRDWEGLAKLVRADGGLLAGDDVRRAWRAVTGADAEGDRVTEVTVRELKADGEGATVYADLVLEPAPAAAGAAGGTGTPQPAHPLAGVDADKLIGLAQGAAGGGKPRPKTVNLAWTWRRLGETWYYTGPLGR